MGNVPLRVKMALGWMIIVVVPLAIVGASFFLYFSSSLERMMKERTERIAENLAAMVEAELRGELRTVSAIASDPDIAEAFARGGIEGSAERKLRSIYARIGSQYEGIFLADRDGVIRVDGTDPKRVGIRVGDRDYFLRAKAGRTNIGDPVLSRATGLPILMACAPILDEDRSFRGAATITLKITLLSDRVASVKVGKTGYSFMIDNRGMVIAHPSNVNILKDDISKMPGVERLASRMIRQETGTERYSYNGVPKVASFAPVDVTGWSVGVTQDRSEFMEPVNAIRRFYLLSGVVFLLITTAGILYHSKNISTPIQKTLSTLNKAIEQSEEAFAIIGPDRKVRFVNPAMERITGRPAADQIGKEPLLDNADLTSPEEIWHVLDQGTVWSGCILGSGAEGRPFNLEATITPIRDERGRIGSYLEIGRDITRELQMEAQIRQGQKMEAIGTLAGGIAHDFNNILSAIFGYAELALASREDRAKTESHIRGILTAAGRARDLVAQILTFSRRDEQENRPLEPGRPINEALKLLRATLPKTIEIRDAIDSKALMMGDPTKLHQVVMNLCTNAAHAMRESGGVLKIVLEDTILDERFARLHPGSAPGPHIRLKVSDTGHGIPPEVRDRIFDPFFTTKPKGEGTGLGLSVVHGIVKSFNGTIEVASEPGKGTEFTLHFPAIVHAAPSPDKTENRELPRGTERVMLVDDEAAITDIEKEMLENLGYRVTVFNESAAALRIFREAPDAFDVVITDYIMPRISGAELIGRMKSIRGDIPFVLCTGHFDPALEKQDVLLAGVERLNKPITTLELALAVRRAIEKRPNA